MDPSLYKDVVTSRGFKYHYYFSAAQDSKPTLIFLHGFPCTSWDWRKQIPFFKDEGYGIIVPDLLGYGGTDKPTDPKDYRQSLLAADVIDILNAEKVETVIAIGHDWGSITASRLANYHPERFTAFAFLAVPYTAPSIQFDAMTVYEMTKQMFGYGLFGYWFFLAEDGIEKLLTDHWKSFVSLVFPHDPSIWTTNLGPMGSMKEWILADKVTPLPSYITEEEIKQYSELLLKGGLAGPLCAYKVLIQNLASEDDKAIPKERYTIQKPVFYAAATKDAISPPAIGEATLAATCPNSTIKTYDSDHWVLLSHADALNKDLLAWMQTL